MRSTRVLAAGLLALILGPTTALADPIRLTGGFFSVTGIGANAVIDMHGAGFRATGSLEPGVVWPDLTCFPCAAGDPIRLDTSFLASNGGGTATVGAAVFPRVGFGALNFLFMAPTIVAPAVAGEFTATEAFTFSGRLYGFYDPDQQDRVFDQMLIGQGLLTASFASVPNPDGPPLFSFRSIRYDFADPAPVPEPGTLLLFASGLGAALRYRHRGRARNASLTPSGAR